MEEHTSLHNIRVVFFRNESNINAWDSYLHICYMSSKVFLNKLHIKTKKTT